MDDELSQRKRALRSRLVALDRAMRSVQGGPAGSQPSPSAPTPARPRWVDATEVGEAIAGHVLAWDGLASVRWAAAYVGQRHEPDTLPLIRGLQARGIEVWLPRIVDGDALAFAPAGDASSWIENAMGIDEPAPCEERECPLADVRPVERGVVFVPGMAFSSTGARIGRGRGYYDRALASVEGRETRVVCVGLARARLVDPPEGDIPEGPHDRRVAWLVTEQGVRRCGAGRGTTPT